MMMIIMNEMMVMMMMIIFFFNPIVAWSNMVEAARNHMKEQIRICNSYVRWKWRQRVKVMTMLMMKW